MSDSARIRQSLKERHTTIWAWGFLIAGAAVVFLVSWGTQYHQLAVGILATSITLAAVELLLAAVWQVLAIVAHFFDGDREA